ncbi:hypothetical protein EOS93_06215 [Rhizobium sp. RMa-01]|uniref:AbiTii domain-containing protein n=1 Tax=unclassified Rhizobium TaxID=2613769 RepID=UPI0008D9A009|nr:MULTISPECIES: hypothetical protein [unclassified Rhizobium]OHV26921.1 hypothetical protein BBJ66_02670 [Rhizobium sp. RSm-3]RVU12256.1 hypothetical protein EOS93_06215 [Rhizobium sp. RMa-01]
MLGLVEEIQRDALNPDVGVSTLLRKVKLAAAKLQLPTIETWVEAELHGYDGPVPPYRKFKGIPKAFNPFRGWIGIQVTAEVYEKISGTSTGQSVAQIEDLLADKAETTFHTPMNRNVVDALNTGTRVQLPQMSVFIGRSDLAGILDTVRNMVLDWAIALEKNGIRGDGMSFSQEEKSAAQRDASITIGSVGTIVGVVGGQNSVRDIVGGNMNLTSVRDLAQQLRTGHELLVSAGADGRSLSSAVDALIVESEKPEPNQGVLRGLLTDARTALAGAAGNLMASGALALISTLLGG